MHERGGGAQEGRKIKVSECMVVVGEVGGRKENEEDKSRRMDECGRLQVNEWTNSGERGGKGEREMEENTRKYMHKGKEGRRYR